jgi:hydrogenase nickel incorporation protein HypA/HybF
VHELSIASQLVDQMTQIAAERGVVRVVEVEVVCGVMQQIVPEALELGFEAVAAGTVVEGAELRIVEEPLAGSCGACGFEYAPRLDDFRCPECGAANPQLTAGQDIVLRSMVCETPEEEVPRS